MVTMFCGEEIQKVVDPSIADYIGSSIYVVIGAKDLFTFGHQCIYGTGDDSITPSSSDKVPDEETQVNPLHKVDAFDDEAVSERSYQLLSAEGCLQAEMLQSGSHSIIPLRDLVVIGFSLCFTNIASGVAAGLSGYSIIFMTVGAVAVNFLLMELGQMVGFRLGAILPDQYLLLFSGSVMISLGLYSILSD